MTATDAAQGPNYPLRQIMLSFSYLAYCGQDITTPNPEAQILGLINAAMKKITPIKPPNPTWTVVWGPAVFTMPGAKYQDNMMFVANNNTHKNQYVIAIRGTNFRSDLDWLMEDLDILQMMPWPIGQKNQPLPGKYISESTSIDLQILLQLMKGTVRGGGSSILDFLQGQTKSGSIKLCVTGHSLGGCVAGTFALYLMENRGLWDKPDENSVVSCITFAAPTAGNAAFAAHSDGAFAGEFKAGRRFPGWDTTLSTNFDAVRCSLDVAPMAWTTHALVTYPNDPTNPNFVFPRLLTIYVNPTDPKIDLDFNNTDGGLMLGPVLQQYLYPELINIMSSRDYGQVLPHKPAATVSGTFHGTVPPGTDPTLKSYVDAYFAQARYQHGQSYPVLLGVPELDTDIIQARRTRRPDTPVA